MIGWVRRTDTAMTVRSRGRASATARRVFEGVGEGRSTVYNQRTGNKAQCRRRRGASAAQMKSVIIVELVLQHREFRVVLSRLVSLLLVQLFRIFSSLSNSTKFFITSSSFS